MPRSPKRSTTTKSLAYAVPEVETLLSFKTAPGAVCTLSHDEVKDHRLQLDADDQGIVRSSRESPPRGETH